VRKNQKDKTRWSINIWDLEASKDNAVTGITQRISRKEATYKR
jgi:hypothetical protein